MNQARRSNAKPYLLYAAQCSWFSAKVRSYLLHKRIPFTERIPTAWQYKVTLTRRTGGAAVPAIVTPEGRWIGDSSAIIDFLEQRHPSRPILPQAPVARVAAHLVEMWADEFWYPCAMWTRWFHDENYTVFEEELGPGFLPHAPAFLQAFAVRQTADMLRSYLPKLGVTREQAAAIEHWTALQLDALEAHFRQHAFLLGAAPTLADYGLMGPLYPHLGRDPWSRRELIEPRPALEAWIERMNRPLPHEDLELSEELPESLTPILRGLLAEMLPYIERVVAELRRAAPHADGKPLPRFLGPVTHPYADARLTRSAMVYVLWMVQRTLDAIAQMASQDQETVRTWLREMGGDGLLRLDVPRLERVGLTVRLREPAVG